MKTNTNFNKGSRVAWSSYSLKMKNLLFSALIPIVIGTGIHAPLLAQDRMASLQTAVAPQVEPDAAVIPDPPQFTKPTWWFGAAVGGNVNFYRGTTQELNDNFTPPEAFHHGQGLGLFLAPMVEWRRPDSKLGVMFQAGYDGRNSGFEHVYSPCDCQQSLTTNLHYITVEPSLRFNPFKSNLYFFAGPRLAFNTAKAFTYSQKTNPNQPEQVANTDVKGDFSHINSTILSMQVGAGYDIPLNDQSHHTQAILSPFVSFQPYMGQDPRSIETWTVTTVRIGAALKFGRGHLITPPVKESAAVAEPYFKFSVKSPENIPVERRVRETFPLRNYVFFDLGSTQIPDRYVLLRKDKVKDFKEDQLEVFTPKKLSGRSSRQMTVYYNVLNVLGDRMGKNPSTVVRLTGASMEGPNDGVAMAESVKKYLVDVFGIAPARINTEGRIKPRIPSEQPGATKELVLLREGDHRVSIWSESPSLMMEFQSGEAAPLMPVEILDVQKAPVDSYITVKVKGAKEAFTSWSLETNDETGKTKYFGPYTEENVAIPGKSIMGDKSSGNYRVTMIGQDGKTVRRDTTLHMVQWTPDVNEEGKRYTVIFEFNDSKAIATYEKYLTDIVTPNIPKNGTVILHGYTDVIGDEAHNKELSMARANDVKTILESALSKANRTDVKFEVYGFGEDENLSQFNNNYPEERFYNRSVVIDIIPAR